MTRTTHVDWLSFTTKLRNPITNLEFAEKAAINSIEYLVGDELATQIFKESEGWLIAGGRRPYQMGYYSKDVGCNVWFGGQDTVLVEFTGSGCNWLRNAGLLLALMGKVQSRVTRIDIAIDLIGDLTPDVVVASLGNKRIKSRGEQITQSGHTIYIGSRKSDKFCRVYRYNEPMPRSDRCRVEYELKRSQAKTACEYILANGIATAADSMSAYYKWELEEMQPEYEFISPMPTEYIERSDAKTMHWLITQCAPAFKKLVEKGAIGHPEQFFKMYFMPENAQMSMFGGLDEMPGRDTIPVDSGSYYYDHDAQSWTALDDDGDAV